MDEGQNCEQSWRWAHQPAKRPETKLQHGINKILLMVYMQTPSYQKLYFNICQYNQIKQNLKLNLDHAKWIKLLTWKQNPVGRRPHHHGPVRECPSNMGPGKLWSWRSYADIWEEVGPIITPVLCTHSQNYNGEVPPNSLSLDNGRLTPLPRRRHPRAASARTTWVSRCPK